MSLGFSNYRSLPIVSDSQITKPLELPEEANKVIFCYVKEVTLGGVRLQEKQASD